jgi:tRNA1(Val) A37 N6-methylase TrmN6
VQVWALPAFAIAARAQGMKVALVEIDPVLCALARHNARLNRLEDRVTVFGCRCGEH